MFPSLMTYLDIPDHLGVLINTSVRTEEAHACNRRDGLSEPTLLVFVGLINEFLRVKVRFEVI